MSNPGPGINVTQQPAGLAALSPGLEIYGLGTLKVYALIEHEMDALGASSLRTNIAMGATFLFAGSLIAAIIGLYSIPDATKPYYVAATVALAGLTALCFVLWLVFMRERAAMIGKIKARSATPVRLEPVAHSADTPQHGGTVR